MVPEPMLCPLLYVHRVRLYEDPTSLVRPLLCEPRLRRVDVRETTLGDLATLVVAVDRLIGRCGPAALLCAPIDTGVLGNRLALEARGRRSIRNRRRQPACGVHFDIGR